MIRVDVARLKLGSLDDQATAAQERHTAFAQIIAELRLLKNFLFYSAEIKTATASVPCLQMLRSLWVLVSEQPEPRCTTQLLHVCADLVAHCEEAQSWWASRLVPTEHNGDARYVLGCVMQIAGKWQVRYLQWSRQGASTHP